MQSELNCSVCGNEYTSENLPRILTTCGHTYCEICLDTMITEQQQNKHKVTCPEDGIATYIQGTELSQFPKNIALIKVIESKKSRITNPFRDQSLQITKILLKQDQRDDQSEQEIINQIQNQKQGSISREETSSKEEIVETIVKPQKKEEFQLCLPHQKPMDVVCLEDMVRICAKCAIFGQHKGHQFKSIENIEEQWDNFRQDIINIYKRKEALEKLISNEETAKYILSMFDQNKRKMQKEVSEKFKRLKDFVRRLEESTIKNLQQLCAKKQQQVKMLFRLEREVEKDYQSWENKSFDLIIQTEECSLEQKLKNLYNYNNTRLLNQGEVILQKIKEHEKNIPNLFEKIIKTINLESKQSVIVGLQSYLLVTEMKEEDQKQEILQVSKVKAKSPLSFEQSLLESDQGEAKQHKQIIINVPSYQSSSKFQQSYKIQKSSPAFSRSLIEKNSHYSEQSVELAVQKIQKPPKKKLKLIKVPEKIQKILDSLYLDTLDLLDLTNAELGDSTILQICEFLRGTKVRVVKFIRNKLTDEVIPKMIYSLGNVITLYLSQNLLTEQTIEYLISNRSSLANLKSVILSQNKIIQRKHKPAIDRLRKLDIVVSV